MEEEDKLRTNMAGMETNQGSSHGAPTLCKDVGPKDKKGFVEANLSTYWNPGNYTDGGGAL